MNALNRSLGLILVLCIVIAAVSVGVSVVYNPFGIYGEREEETIRYRDGSFLETHEDDEVSAHFQWMGHSFLSENTVSIQIKYSGNPIEHFDEKEIVFLINGRECGWLGQIVKGQGGRVTMVEDGATIYILATFKCTVKKGDTLTFKYQPLNLEVSAQL